MKTQYYTATSLDGYIADPDDSLEWLFQFSTGDEPTYDAFIREVGALAMGSTTYEWLLSHEIFPEGRDPKPWFYEQPSWVFSTRELRRVPGADVRFVRGDVRPVHAEMAAAAGTKNIWVVGGGELVGQFYDHGLLDQIIVQIAPVTLGGGAPLLPRNITKPPLKLVSSKRHGDFTELWLEVPRRT